MELCQRLNADPSAQALEFARCAADPVFWCHRWAWTYDPREKVSTLPFALFAHQEAFLRWLMAREEAQEDGLVEKSRDMGLTWLCCVYALWGWLFRDGFKCGFGSRKLDLVDKIGDPDCIFEKLRFLWRNLPVWMLPEGFKAAAHDGYCKLTNPANGATITGEGGANIGRGGRASLYFVDEAAFLEHPESIDAALSQTTRTRIDVSTPNGMGNPFYRKRHSGAVPVFTFHWRDDPRKDQAWYDAQVKRLDDPVIVAQEIDLDYAASVEGICIPARWVQAAVLLFQSDAFRAAYPDYDTGRFSVVAGLDVADEGKNRNVLITRRGPLVCDIADWQSNATESAWRARDKGVEFGVTSLAYDVIGVGTNVKNAWQMSEQKPPFTTTAIDGGAAASDDAWPGGKLGKEMFLNLRAELWWKLRRRFERAYEFLHEGKPHKPEDMISIPAHPELIADLCVPLVFHTDTGKIKLESKADMRRRGVKSPDFGDALAYAFAPFAADWKAAAARVQESLAARQTPIGVPGGVW